MTQIACKDLGWCDDYVTASDEEDLKMKLLDHAKDQHPAIFSMMHPESIEELKDKIRRFALTI